ncbi:MAG: ParB N-terminal domain-containing protein [Nitrososphaerota archaeon]|nr:ParB N-terminal domain-containing protein [Nitrososphaerota archaeon]
MSSNAVKAAFEKQIVVLPLEIIVPQKTITPGHRKGEFYRQLTASLQHVGLIEPLVVYPRGPGDYLLLEGHMRLEILKSMGVRETKCLLSTDDEAYTYNRHVNHIPAIAQHFMLLEALKTGLTEERIASALDVSLESIRVRRDLLNGICPEVVQIFIDKPISPQVFSILRKMKPIRQIEAAEHMVAGGTYTIPFAKALLAVTKPELLEGTAASSKQIQATSMAARSMLEEENEFLLRDLKSVEESYGTNVLTLTVAYGYLDRLLKNPKIERYLARHHVDILHTLQKLLSDNGLKAVNSGYSKS